MKIVIITVVVYTLILLGILSVIPAPQESRYYDCGLAEIHPDYPKEVREECRKLRSKTPTQAPGLTT